MSQSSQQNLEREMCGTTFYLLIKSLGFDILQNQPKPTNRLFAVYKLLLKRFSTTVWKSKGNLTWEAVHKWVRNYRLSSYAGSIINPCQVTKQSKHAANRMHPPNPPLIGHRRDRLTVINSLWTRMKTSLTKADGTREKKDREDCQASHRRGMEMVRPGRTTEHRAPGGSTSPDQHLQQRLSIAHFPRFR